MFVGVLHFQLFWVRNALCMMNCDNRNKKEDFRRLTLPSLVNLHASSAEKRERNKVRRQFSQRSHTHTYAHVCAHAHTQTMNSVVLPAVRSTSLIFFFVYKLLKVNPLKLD